jgi:hypothetical protein
MRARREGWQMNDRRPLNAMAALEQAQAQLELALRPDAHWRALARATLPAHRAALERALADNPVFQAWKLLGQAIAAVRGEGAADQAAAATGAVPPQGPTRPPRIELRQVLERIRSETPFDTAEPTEGAVAATEDGPAALQAEPRAAPTITPADIEIEEATVTFIVREPATVPSPVEPAVAPKSLQASRLETSAGADAPPGAPAGDDDDDTEAEVTIVPRRT